MVTQLKPSKKSAKQSPDTVKCPTCHGKGRREFISHVHPGKHQICLACRGTGQVHPDRVCARCGQWAVNCICNISRNVQTFTLPADMLPLVDQEPEQKPESPDIPKGIIWNKATHKYHTSIYRKPNQYYLGDWKDLKTAIAIRLEAESLPVEEFPALKARYRAMRDGKFEQTVTHHMAIVVHSVQQDAPDSQDLVEAYDAARQADEQCRAAQDAYDATSREFQERAEAVQETRAAAVAAWKHVLALLGQLAGPSSLIDQVLAEATSRKAQ